MEDLKVKLNQAINILEEIKNSLNITEFNTDYKKLNLELQNKSFIKDLNCNVKTGSVVSQDPVIFTFRSGKITSKWVGHVDHIEQPNTHKGGNTNIWCVGASWILKDSSQKIYKNVTAEFWLRVNPNINLTKKIFLINFLVALTCSLFLMWMSGYFSVNSSVNVVAVIGISVPKLTYITRTTKIHIIVVDFPTICIDIGKSSP